MSQPLRTFPELPAYRARWAPVYLEPITGSGERITAAVAAIDEQGAWDVRSAIHERALRCFFGGRAEALAGIVAACVDNLSEHLERTHEIESWPAPLAGLALGPVSQTYANDMESVLRMALNDTAFLSGLPPVDMDETATVEEVPSPDLLSSEVKSIVTDLRPELRNFFKRKLTIGNRKFGKVYDYLGNRLVGQFGRMTLGRGLAQNVRSAKVKLWDLDSLRTAAETPNLFETDHPRYELMLIRPRHLGERTEDRDRFEEAIESLVAEGDRHELRVREVFSANDAAREIIKAESVAA